MYVWGGEDQLVTPGGGGGEGLGRAPNTCQKQMTPDPLACGQLIAVCVCEGGGEYQLVTLGGGGWTGGGGGSFSRPPTRVHLWGGRVGGAGGQSKCEGDERGVALEELNS